MLRRRTREPLVGTLKDVPQPQPVMSRLCTKRELETPAFQRWGELLREPHMRWHRKLWEWCFISNVLEEDGMLQAGRRGVGFAVGHEPLVAAFAARGPHILATDLDVERAAEAGWVDSGEHAASLERLNDRGLCDPAEFAERVTFQSLDMVHFDPADLGEFDFIWSSCAFEHLGSLQRGLDYVVRAMEVVRPGGLAVHTTEFNVSSNDETLDDGGTVIYRRRDIEELVDDLQARGYEIEVDWSMGDQPADYDIDVPPYTHDPHLKLRFANYTTTSIGLVVRRP